MKKQPSISKSLKDPLLILIISSLCVVNQLSAQPLAVEWERTFGGSDYDMPAAIIETADGGYLAAGTTLSSDGDVERNYGGADGLLLKLDSKGNLQWKRNYGGTGDDQIKTVIQLKNGDFLVAGGEFSVNGTFCGNHGFRDSWVMRISPTGKLIWERTFGGSLCESFNSAFETSDGGYLFAGNSSSTDGDVKNNFGHADYWVVKTDSHGVLMWERTYGGEGSESLFKAIALTSGEYVLAGVTRENGSVLKIGGGAKEIFLIKIDESGNRLHQKTLTCSKNDYVSSLNATANGGYILGIVFNPIEVDPGDSTGSLKKRCSIVKMNNAGSVEWEKSFGNLREMETPVAVFPMDDSGYLICGTAHFVNKFGKIMRNKTSFWLTQLDADLNIRWQKILPDQNRMISTSFEKGADGSLLMMGGLFTKDIPVQNKGFEDFRIIKLNFSSQDEESSRKSN